MIQKLTQRLKHTVVHRTKNLEKSTFIVLLKNVDKVKSTVSCMRKIIPNINALMKILRAITS